MNINGNSSAIISIIVATELFLTNFVLAEDNMKRNMIPAKICAILTSKETPGRILITINLANKTKLTGDFLSIAQEDKIGKEIFHPIKTRWYLSEKLVCEDVTALQQTFSIEVGATAEINLLIKHPDYSGKYRVIVELQPLEGTVNDAFPVGFMCETQIVIDGNKVFMNNESEQIPIKKKLNDKSSCLPLFSPVDNPIQEQDDVQATQSKSEVGSPAQSEAGNQ